VPREACQTATKAGKGVVAIPLTANVEATPVVSRSEPATIVAPRRCAVATSLIWMFFSCPPIDW